jgi:hypothetical protein
MKRRLAALLAAAVLPGCFATGAAAAADEVVVVKPAHRTAADLAPAVAAALGGEGGVTVDERTGSLVISGSSAAVARARAVLAQLDVKPRTILIRAQIIDQDEFAGLGIRVDWTVAGGGWRIGRLPDDGASPDGTLRLSAGGKTKLTRSSDAARISVRVLEGETATLIAGHRQEYRASRFGWSELTGPALSGTIREVQTALVVRPRVVGDEIELQLLPEAAAFGPDGSRLRRSIAASTTVRVKNGGQIVVGAGSSQASSQLVDVFHGFAQEDASGSQALLIGARVEGE